MSRQTTSLKCHCTEYNWFSIMDDPIRCASHQHLSKQLIKRQLCDTQLISNANFAPPVLYNFSGTYSRICTFSTNSSQVLQHFQHSICKNVLECSPYCAKDLNFFHSIIFKASKALISPIVHITLSFVANYIGAGWSYQFSSQNIIFGYTMGNYC